MILQGSIVFNKDGCNIPCSIEVTSLNENIKTVYGVNFFEMFKKILIRVKGVKEELTSIAENKKDDKKDEPKDI